MNFKVILLASLMVIIFVSIVLFGYIIYSLSSETKSGKDIYNASKTLYFITLGIQIKSLILAGFLIMKQ